MHSKCKGITLFSLPGKRFCQGSTEETPCDLWKIGFRRNNAGSTLEWLWNCGPTFLYHSQFCIVLWEYAKPAHMCFVDLDPTYDDVPWQLLWVPLLCAVWSLYEHSESGACLFAIKLKPFKMAVRHHPWCVSSPFLFVVFKDRISRNSQC